MSVTTSLKSEPCAYKYDLKESVGPGKYMLENPLQECKQTFQVSPYVRSTIRHGHSYTPEWIDIHSDLSGRTRPNTDCPENKYQPGTKNRLERTIHVRPDSEGILTEDTKLSNPPCTLRGRGINRWEWLCEDPQKHALTPFELDGRMGVSNRIVVKDNHRPCIPKPARQDVALPPAENLSIGVRYIPNSNENDMYWKKIDDVIIEPTYRTCEGIRALGGKV